MKDIKELLERYYSGETSLEEERFLREHPGLADMDSASEQMFAATGLYRQQIGLCNKRKRPFRVWIWSVSASVAAAVLLFWIIGNEELSGAAGEDPWPSPVLVDRQMSGEIQDEALALEQARKALAYVSAKLNQGASGLNHIEKLNYPSTAIKNQDL